MNELYLKDLSLITKIRHIRIYIRDLIKDKIFNIKDKDFYDKFQKQKSELKHEIENKLNLFALETFLDTLKIEFDELRTNLMKLLEKYSSVSSRIESAISLYSSHSYYGFNKKFKYLYRNLVFRNKICFHLHEILLSTFDKKIKEINFYIMDLHEYESENKSGSVDLSEEFYKKLFVSLNENPIYSMLHCEVIRIDAQLDKQISSVDQQISFFMFRPASITTYILQYFLIVQLYLVSLCNFNPFYDIPVIDSTIRDACLSFNFESEKKSNNLVDFDRSFSEFLKHLSVVKTLLLSTSSSDTDSLLSLIHNLCISNTHHEFDPEILAKIVPKMIRKLSQSITSTALLTCSTSIKKLNEFIKNLQTINKKFSRIDIKLYIYFTKQFLNSMLSIVNIHPCFKILLYFNFEYFIFQKTSYIYLNYINDKEKINLKKWVLRNFFPKIKLRIKTEMNDSMNSSQPKAKNNLSSYSKTINKSKILDIISQEKNSSEIESESDVDSYSYLNDNPFQSSLPSIKYHKFFIDYCSQLEISVSNEIEQDLMLLIPTYQKIQSTNPAKRFSNKKLLDFTSFDPRENYARIIFLAEYILEKYRRKNHLIIESADFIVPIFIYELFIDDNLNLYSILISLNDYTKYVGHASSRSEYLFTCINAAFNYILDLLNKDLNNLLFTQE